jgi:exosortase C (VPDSG-CTERM-specific)
VLRPVNSSRSTLNPNLNPEPSLKDTASPHTQIVMSRNWANGSPASRARVVGFFSFAFLLTAVFVKPLFSLATHAAHSELDSYIVLVPFISAYLIYVRRTQLPKEYGFSPWAIVPLLAGLAALATALSLHRSGRALSDHDYLSLMALSFVCLLAGGGFLFLGRKWMLSTAFPFAFLIFMVPMPDAMADTLETASKLASAEATNLFFNITGTPVLRDGTVFQLPNITIRVAQECSGIRSSWVLVLTSLLAANLFLKSTWRRVILVCTVIPLGIVRNGFRVWVISMLCLHIGPGMIHSIIHRRGGPIFFALSLIPLFLLLWWLRRGEIARNDRGKNRLEVWPK